MSDRTRSCPLRRPPRPGWGLGGAILLVASLPGLAALPALPADDVPEEAVTRAEAALKPFQQELFQELSNALAEGGPTAALSVCRDRAPAIAASHSRDGVEMGRTSHRLRNPANASPDWVAPLLDAAAADPAAAKPTAVRIGADRIGFVSPIRTAGACLKCHGSDLDPEVTASLAELYPADRATGFAEGDLRGLFWVTVPLDPPPSH